MIITRAFYTWGDKTFVEDYREGKMNIERDGAILTVDDVSFSIPDIQCIRLAQDFLEGDHYAFLRISIADRDILAVMVKLSVYDTDEEREELLEIVRKAQSEIVGHWADFERGAQE